MKKSEFKQKVENNKVSLKMIAAYGRISYLEDIVKENEERMSILEKSKINFPDDTKNICEEQYRAGKTVQAAKEEIKKIIEKF